VPITDEAGWKRCRENNSDPYGGAIVKVAERVMAILDDDEPSEIDAYELICRADDETKAGGITGFMAGAAASIVSHVHSRGDEFRKSWNKSCGVEGDVAGVANPAILTVTSK